MSTNQTVLKSQLFAANMVLEQLRDAISPEFLGLVATTGQSITIISSSLMIDTDILAALTASSFAATKQLTGIMKVSGFTITLHEGAELNLSIAQVNSEMLLVICFHKSSDIGKIRLISRHAVESLSMIFASNINLDRAG